MSERVAKTLLGYGQRVQYSVFEVLIHSTAELNELYRALQAVADEETNIRFYHLCEHCRKASRDLLGEALMEFPAVLIM